MLGFLVLVIFVGWLFSQYYGSPNILWFAVVFSSGTAIFSYWFSDRVVLLMAGGREEITKENHPRIFALVENLTKTAGLPMPKLYLLNETAPNAFATGRSPKHSVVALTRGLVDRLSEKELEGVIAHELSHIQNRDMLVSTVVVVLAGFITILSDFLMRSLWFGGWGSRRDDRREGNSLLIFFAIAAAILAPLAALLIRLAITRKREFLADSSGAALTKNPEGLAGALVKISQSSQLLRHAHQATAHLYIESPFKSDLRGQRSSWFVKIFSTHPPVEERVAALLGK